MPLHTARRRRAQASRLASMRRLRPPLLRLRERSALCRRPVPIGTNRAQAPAGRARRRYPHVGGRQLRVCARFEKPSHSRGGRRIGNKQLDARLPPPRRRRRPNSNLVARLRMQSPGRSRPALTVRDNVKSQHPPLRVVTANRAPTQLGPISLVDRVQLGTDVEPLRAKTVEHALSAMRERRHLQQGEPPLYASPRALRDGSLPQRARPSPNADAARQRRSLPARMPLRVAAGFEFVLARVKCVVAEVKHFDVGVENDVDVDRDVVL